MAKKQSLKSFRAPPDVEATEFNDDFKNIPEPVKRRRERFVHEYIKDFNGSNAIRRMGSQSNAPWVRASEWLNEPYTQWYLGQILPKLEEHAIVTRNEVLVGLKKEANYFGMDGGAAARISAWRAMAKILGIEVTKVEGTVNLGGGVMLLPSAGTPAEWEAAAAKAQKELKEAVRK